MPMAYASLETPLMTALSPPQSPPLVMMPILLMGAINPPSTKEVRRLQPEFRIYAQLLSVFLAADFCYSISFHDIPE
jgi:hypothetical protein